MKLDTAEAAVARLYIATTVTAALVLLPMLGVGSKCYTVGLLCLSLLRGRGKGERTVCSSYWSSQAQAVGSQRLVDRRGFDTETCRLNGPVMASRPKKAKRPKVQSYLAVNRVCQAWHDACLVIEGRPFP